MAGRLRFLHQPQFRQTGQSRRFHRQSSRHFVERGWHGQHQFLPLQRLTRKVLVPGGFMPGFNKGTFTAEICAEWSGTDPIAQLVSTHHKSGKDHKEHTRASHVCPYATLVMAAVSGADAALVLQTLTYILALGFMPVVAPVLQRAAKLRPPLRGPPPVSRA